MRREFNVNVVDHRCRCAGFTLIELVAVMLVVTILGAMSVGFIRSSVTGYVHSERNVELADRTDYALRRMARDVRNALPNSVRVAVNGNNSFLEYVPIVTAGRYRAGTDGSGSGDYLDFSLADSSFDVLGPTITASAGNKLVIYNLGIDVSDIYLGNNTADVVGGGSGLQKLTFTAKQFALASPNHRFYIVAGASSYACDRTNGRLLQYRNYSILTSQTNTVAGLNALTTASILLDGLTECVIEYAPGVLQRTGVVTITLKVESNGAVARLMHLVNVVNSP
ncbi:MAG TPA: type II secretion system protein [Methylophilus sp.]